MQRIERAVSAWHRVYTELCAAQDCLRRGDTGPSGDGEGSDEDLVSQVHRLQDEEEQALRAIHDALSARAVEKARQPGGGPPAQ